MSLAPTRGDGVRAPEQGESSVLEVVVGELPAPCQRPIGNLLGLGANRIVIEAVGSPVVFGEDTSGCSRCRCCALSGWQAHGFCPHLASRPCERQSRRVPRLRRCASNLGPPSAPSWGLSCAAGSARGRGLVLSTNARRVLGQTLPWLVAAASFPRMPVMRPSSRRTRRAQFDRQPWQAVDIQEDSISQLSDKQKGGGLCGKPRTHAPFI